MLSDQELVLLALENPENYNLLMQRYWHPLSSFICRKYRRDISWAEDIAQEAMLRAFKSLGRYDPSKSWSTWLFSIALNIAKSDLSRPQPLPLENYYCAPSSEPEIE